MGRLLLVALVAISLVGCQTGNLPWANRTSGPDPDYTGTDSTYDTTAVPPPPSGLQASPSPRFGDIPLPVGLAEDPERTFVYEAPNLAVGRMTYTSRASVGELANFYIQEAATNGWEMGNVIQSDDAELTFSKPAKRLHVKIENIGVTKGRRLTITLTPAGTP